MFGRTTLFFVIAVALIGAAWWFNPLGRGTARHDGGGAKGEPFEYGEPLYPVAEAPKRSEPAQLAFVADPIVVPDCTLNPMLTMNVPSQQDGQLVLIGTTLTPEQAKALPPDQYEVRKIHGTDKEFYFRRLKEDDRVESDQVVALVNPVKALDKLTAAEAKHKVAVAQYFAADKLSIVATREVERLQTALSAPGARSVSASELALRSAERDKALEDKKAKFAEIDVAKAEVSTATTEVNLHHIRNLIPCTSIVKSIEKKAGEAVKTSETVMVLQSNSLLRAEGMIDTPYMPRLKKGTRVRVEPSYEEAPLKIFLGHRREITSVAVSQNGKEPLIVSGSLDKMMAVWNATTGRMVVPLPHPEAVRVVATAPKGSKKNWCLSACIDGSVRLWDLDNLDAAPVLLKNNPHRDAVTALAFSPDGRWFATGGADNLICLWNTEDASLVYPFDHRHGVDNGPQGQITALAFTPQCRLVSAGRDNALRVWDLFTKGPRLLGSPITDRSGTVPMLGVSQDGQQMLFDQGKTLQVLSVTDGRTEAVVKKPSTATPFETLALFSPDASLILTAGAAEGRLQLWRAPTAARRAFEVRVLSSTDRSPATCAAFAPKDVTVAGRSFAVSGTREGQVILWPLPTPKEIEEAPVSGVLSLVESSVEASGRQARIGVEIDNSNNRLIPGKQATVVIAP